MNYKLLCIKNFSGENVPIRNASDLFTKFCNSKNEALIEGRKFLKSNKNSYFKVWCISTNEILHEETNITK